MYLFLRLNTNLIILSSSIQFEVVVIARALEILRALTIYPTRYYCHILKSNLKFKNNDYLLQLVSQLPSDLLERRSLHRHGPPAFEHDFVAGNICCGCLILYLDS